MSKKFFSLIHEGKIHLAPGKKVIPADAFSTLLDAQEVLTQVKKDAEQYRLEIVSQSEKYKEQAKKEGFEQGYADWVKKIAELEEEIKKVREDLQKVVIPIALKAAKKIVGKELELSEETVVDIISHSLKAVSQHKKIKIYVNRKDYEVVEKNRERIRKIFENLEALSILPQNDVEQGGCIIETEGGIINAQLENQWMILENAFQKMLKKDAVAHPVEPPKIEESTKKEKVQK